MIIIIVLIHETCQISPLSEFEPAIIIIDDSVITIIIITWAPWTDIV